MISARTSLLVLMLLIIAVIIFTYSSIGGIDIINSKTNNSQLIINNSSPNDSPKSITIDECILRENLTLPSKEFILNNINWSSYPLLSNPYIHAHEISDPTDVIFHKFLYVTIVVQVNDVSNDTEVLKQLSGVALEEQKTLGPNSGPNVWGTADGVWVYYAAIMPYESDVYARCFR